MINKAGIIISASLLLNQVEDSVAPYFNLARNLWLVFAYDASFRYCIQKSLITDLGNHELAQINHGSYGNFNLRILLNFRYI